MKKIKYEKYKLKRIRIKNYYDNITYQNYILFFVKVILVIILLKFDFKRNSLIILNTKSKNIEKIESSEFIEKNDPISLSLNVDHYKILLPKNKTHIYKKKFNPEDKYNLFKLEDSIDFKKIQQSKSENDNYIYHSCILAKAKHENLYIREFVDYYINLGVEKFYFGDDNPDDFENLSDMLNDYIKKGIVDIEYISFRNLSHYDFFEYAFRSLKLRCKCFYYMT